MTVNAATIDLITEFEGFVDHWYQDPVGIWTVCYGHTDAAGAPFYATSKDKVFSKAEGREILAKDLRDVEAVVRNAVRVAINENQIGALVSFTFNVGEGNFTKSTLLKKVNAGMFVEASTEFSKWNRAKGKVLKGLTRRRAAEAALFSRPIPVEPPIPIPPKPNRPPIEPDPPAHTSASRGLIGWVILSLIALGGAISGIWSAGWGWLVSLFN